MPDNTFQSVSASQLGALYDLSNYTTKWSLFQEFKNKIRIDSSNNRTDWGHRMQPLILDVLAEDKRLEIVPNEKDTYIRNGIIGCTRDAEIIDPSRGPGALEIKCVFDYKQYGEKWDMGERVPIEYELQMQAQMGVGDGIASYQWGIFAVWVCGSMTYFERKLDPAIYARMQADVSAFFEDVAAGRTPDPTGAPTEYEWIKAAYPALIHETRVIEDEQVTESARQYEYFKAQESFAKKTKDRMKSRLFALAEGCDILEFPFGRAYFKMTKSGARKMDVRLSEDIPTRPEILDTEKDL